MLKHKDLIDFTKNPFELFNNWFDLANETEVNDPNAMTLSTILNNHPSSRVVLLKSHSEEGFVFYTNSNSKKGKSISENNNIASDRAREKRGNDEFIEISWAEAIDIISKELNRVKTKFTNKSIFAGSYGWASAGRFHHAQSQLHRFFNCFGGYVKSVTTYSYAASETIIPPR